MSDGFQFLDIVSLAMIAGFVALRLGSVLGRRTGNESRPAPRAPDGTAETHDNATDLSARDRAALDPGLLMPGVKPESSLGKALSRITVADRSFNTEQFAAGACGAFEMILSAFSHGDRETLEPLVNEEVYADFVSAIDAREKAEQSLDTKIVDLMTSTIENATLDGSIAEITVLFEAEIISVLRDSESRILEGSPSDTETIKNVWTFARDTSNQDPNWLLIATEIQD